MFKILSPSQPAYYKLVPNLTIILRNVYQGDQQAMLIYCHPVNLCTINLVLNLNIIPRNVYIGVTKEQC